MKRRGFLKMAVAAPIAVAAPKILVAAEPYVAKYVHQTVVLGYSIMPDEVWVDEAAFVPGRSGILMRAEFARQLEEGLRKVFDEEYVKHLESSSSEEWKKLYECQPEIPKHVMRTRSEFCRECGMSLEEIVNRGEDYCYGRER
jgi:hypothetical protein